MDREPHGQILVECFCQFSKVIGSRQDISVAGNYALGAWGCGGFCRCSIKALKAISWYHMVLRRRKPETNSTATTSPTPPSRLRKLSHLPPSTLVTNLFILLHSSFLTLSPANSLPTSKTVTTPAAPPTPNRFPSFSSHVTFAKLFAGYPP